MSERAMPNPNCPECHGDGWVVDVVTSIETEAGCCGNFLRTGECCGEPIPVPVEVAEQVQVSCPSCSSEGFA